jgi:hypothetical protein
MGQFYFGIDRGVLTTKVFAKAGLDVVIISISNMASVVPADKYLFSFLLLSSTKKFQSAVVRADVFQCPAFANTQTLYDIFRDTSNIGIKFKTIFIK